MVNFVEKQNVLYVKRRKEIYKNEKDSIASSWRKCLEQGKPFYGLDGCRPDRKGVAEAEKAGVTLKEYGFNFDKAYTSYLKRAVKTLNCVLDKMDLDWIPVEKLALE